MDDGFAGILIVAGEVGCGAREVLGELVFGGFAVGHGGQIETVLDGGCKRRNVCYSTS